LYDLVDDTFSVMIFFSAWMSQKLPAVSYRIVIVLQRLKLFLLYVKLCLSVCLSVYYVLILHQYHAS